MLKISLPRDIPVVWRSTLAGLIFPDLGGVEVVCDDGICAKCIKNRGVTPSPTINKEDPEDYLLDLSALNNSKTLLMLQMFVIMVTVLDAR